MTIKPTETTNAFGYTLQITKKNAKPVNYMLKSYRQLIISVRTDFGHS